MIWRHKFEHEVDSWSLCLALYGIVEYRTEQETSVLSAGVEVKGGLLFEILVIRIRRKLEEKFQSVL